MNDATLKELKTVVERAVRPVRASMARKRKMREELLAHLVSIFEEESRHDDEQAALERAKQRFGDPGELMPQLQQAVPRCDRCSAILENMGYQPAEPAWHLAGKHFLTLLLLYSLWLPIWLLAHGNFRDLGRDLGPVQLLHLWILTGAVLLVVLWNVILSIVLAPLLHRVGPVLTSTRRGRTLLTLLCGLVVLCGLVLPAFTGVAVLSFLMARQAVKQWRYQAEWA